MSAPVVRADWQRCDRCDVRWRSDEDSCWACGGPAIKSTEPFVLPVGNDPTREVERTA